MPDVHDTAILNGDVQLADDVVIGPNCSLMGDIKLGSGTRLIGNVWLQGPLTIGENNLIYPFACIGFAPQHTRFDPQTDGLGTIIGNGNTFRESATVHRAFADVCPTTIGDNNFFMANSHVGHDSVVHNNCTMVQGSALGGHVELEDSVNVGGNSGIHQHVRIGRGAMIGAGLITTADLAPWHTLTGYNLAGSLNVIGLRRSRQTKDDIADVRWGYQTINRKGLTIPQAMEVLRQRADHPAIAELIAFLEKAKRPICTARPKRSRGQS